MSTLERMCDFADRLGVNRSTVTRWRAAGRLVLSDDGRVDVEASQRRLEATRGGRFDVSARWDAHRGAPIQTGTAAPELAPEPEPTPDDPLDLDEVGRRTRVAQMRKEEAIARQKEREDQELAGMLVRKAEVKRDLTDAATIILGVWESLPDRLAPILTGIEDPARVRAILRDEVEQMGHQVSAQLDAVARGRSNHE